MFRSIFNSRRTFSRVMTEVSEEALITAIENRQTLFEIMEEGISSDKRRKVFQAICDWKVQSELVEETGVSAGTVSGACKELEDMGLIRSREEGGYVKTIKSLDHPLLQYLYKKEIVNE